jgi:hypothetical protein
MTGSVDPVAKTLASQVWLGCVLLAIVGAFSANPLEMAAGACVPAILFQLLWRTGETPTLLFCTLFQWLQAYLPTVSASLEGTSFTDRLFGSELRTATWLSLLGVVILALGIHIALRNQPRIVKEMDRQIRSLSLHRLFVAYFAIWILSLALEYALFLVPTLRAPMMSLLLFKWIPLYLLAMHTFAMGKGFRFLLIPVAIEIVMGMTGYFSSFKSVLFLLLVVAIGIFVRTSRVQWSRIVPIVVSTVLLVGIWQGVKGKHRQFISGGTGEQVVVVSFQERATNLARLIADLNADLLLEAFNSGLDRLGYVEYFAYSIQNVPSKIPHERGALWLGTVQHVLMPRVLFPRKAIIDDSERTTKYTLRKVAGGAEGTSIGIGYIGESYIDFGMYGMFVPIFLLGIMYGLIYRWFVRTAPNPLLGVAFATSLLLFPASLLETSNIKIVGGVVTGFLLFALTTRFAGKAIWDWACGRPISAFQFS